MKNLTTLSAITMLSTVCLSCTYAATPVNLAHQPVSVLKGFIARPALKGTASSNSLARMSADTDFNKTTHIRVKQLYMGHPVWGADAVIHAPAGSGSSLASLANSREAVNVSMNGTLYTSVQEDLINTPAYVFSKAAADKILARAIQLFESDTGMKHDISRGRSDLIVYIDEANKAHWAYVTRFFAKTVHGMPAIPVYIIDAVSLEVYQQWNDLKTLRNVDGGGLGGNEGKIGRLNYDGLPGDFPKLIYQRDDKKKLCYLQNDLTIVRDKLKNDTTPSFKCAKADQQHNNVYWNTNPDSNNGGYSPDNDAIYSDTVVRDLYKSWFNIDMLSKDGKPMQVIMHTHDPDQGQNAYYEDGEMVFGDGDDESYPVVAPSVVAHEMSHAFTEQHSDLIYQSQSGGLNESFSDMADKAMEYKVYGKNIWQIDPELLKEGGRLLRWMDDPTQDCNGRQPGDKCSIAHMKDYYEGIDVHFSSGIFNKAFYLLSTSPGWNTRMAFEIMTQANMHYWTPATTFNEAACGVINAARDYKYDTASVDAAMKEVGLDTSSC